MSPRVSPAGLPACLAFPMDFPALDSDGTPADGVTIGVARGLYVVGFMAYVVAADASEVTSAGVEPADEPGWTVLAGQVSAEVPPPGAGGGVAWSGTALVNVTSATGVLWRGAAAAGPGTTLHLSCAFTFTPATSGVHS